MNKRYDPFDVKLDGWSESVMENMEDFDNVFERLHDKYKTKAEVAPEIELLLSLAGSAFMFHLTNTLFKAALPNMNDIAKQNPDLMNNIAQAMMSNMQQRSGMAAPTSSMNDGPPPSATTQPPPPPPVSGRREMRGPSNSMGGMGGMGGPMGDISSMMSGMGPIGDMMSGMMNNVMSGGPIDFPPPPMSAHRANENMPPLPKASEPPAYNPVVEEVNDNESIISGGSGMSGDVGEIDGLSDITSVSSINFDNNTKSVSIVPKGGRGKGGKGRGRGRPKKADSDKNEVTINV